MKIACFCNKISSSSPLTYTLGFSYGRVRDYLTHCVHLKRELKLLLGFDSLPSHLARMPSQEGGSSLKSISPTPRVHPSNSTWMKPHGCGVTTDAAFRDRHDYNLWHMWGFPQSKHHPLRSVKFTPNCSSVQNLQPFTKIHYNNFLLIALTYSNDNMYEALIPLSP